jgi:hypothetical protein
MVMFIPPGMDIPMRAAKAVTPEPAVPNPGLKAAGVAAAAVKVFSKTRPGFGKGPTANGP